MRRGISWFLLAFCASFGLAAEPEDGLETARRLAASGAPQLALNHIERSQPRDPAAPRWAEWEALRLNSLAQLDRHPDLLLRVSALPPTMPAPQMREALMLATRAAVAADQGTTARQYAARMLWQLGPSAEEVRVIRLLVIESYVAEMKGDEAFRSMLRFDQDYRPLDRQTATRFVEGLLGLGMAGEAVNWLAGLDDDGPLKLLLRLRANLTSAQAASEQARALLRESRSPGYWRVLAHAAPQLGDRAAHVEALEQLLHLDGGKTIQRTAAEARDLWQAYLGAAQEAAGQGRLLTGDDRGWADFAGKQLALNAPLARALFAYLALRGKTADMRNGMQAQLVSSLQASGLERAALRLFNDGPLDIASVDTRTRRQLGAIAERRDVPALALHFWRGVNPPADANVEEWHLRVASVALRAGRADAAAAAIRQAMTGKKAPPLEFSQRSVALVQELLDMGHLDLADGLFTALLPLVDGAARRHVLSGLARINEVTGRFPVAAEFYVRSALLAEGKIPDAHALQARLAAALNLARAGYRRDARAQFEWVLKNAKDIAQLEIARRELKKLQADDVQP
ncbi:MAG: hypothetical protein HY526_02495 [Betaproteobacteria bacterium]|nr:hypothetical protein [Betaproteobacteria bacterium]